MKTKLIISSILLFIIWSSFSCKKTPEIPNATNKKGLPTVSTNPISNITHNSVISGGDVRANSYFLIK